MDRPTNVPNRIRWIRIGMLVLFALGLLGMLFGCGSTGELHRLADSTTSRSRHRESGATNQSVTVQLTSRNFCCNVNQQSRYDSTVKDR